MLLFLRGRGSLQVFLHGTPVLCDPSQSAVIRSHIATFCNESRRIARTRAFSPRSVASECVGYDLRRRILERFWWYRDDVEKLAMGQDETVSP